MEGMNAGLLATGRGFEELGSLEMVLQQLWQLFRGCAAEAAIGRQTEARHEFARRCQPFAEAMHAVDHAEVYAGIAGFEPGEGCVESFVRAVEHRNVNPICSSPGRSNTVVMSDSTIAGPSIRCAGASVSKR